MVTRVINDHYDEAKVQKAIAEALECFYKALIAKIDSININDIIKTKNPYLYRAKAMNKAYDIINSILQAFVSSSEETIFGNVFFEPLAIAASNGKKSLAEGVDIDIADDAAKLQYAIAVKSGTSVFNADSKKRQAENFARARKLAAQGHYNFSAIIGYAYGTKQESDRGSAKIYIELAGEEFWTMLTGDKDFFKKIITFMGELPERYVDDYNVSYDKACNRLVRDFSREFCNEDGSINWEKLVDFNSGSPTRKSQERFEICAKRLYAELQKKPTSTKAKLCEDVGVGSSFLNKLLAWMEDERIIKKGYEGKKNGWTITGVLPFKNDSENNSL